MRFLKLTCFGLLLVLSHGIYAQAPILTLTIPNINPVKGELQVSVYKSSDSFLKKGEEYQIYRFEINESIGRFSINNLPKGEYSIIVYHDKNNNKKADRTFLGIPKEGYAFSKNFKPRPRPSFDDCRINLDQDVSMIIKLIY